MDKNDLALLLLARINEAEIENPSGSFRFRMRENVFVALAAVNYQACKETGNYHFAGIPVAIDNSIPETSMGKDFSSDIFVEEYSND